MTYREAIEFLYNLRWFGTKLGLENTFKLAGLMGNPHQGLRFIHVAGTNGKGSTCAILESVYRAAGLRTGLFTSPHLVSFTERIQVNRVALREQEVARLVEEVLDGIWRGNGGERNQEKWEFRPTFFEVVAVMGLMAFARAECELVIWETGMGGRLDATNIVTPLASVITNVQLDHEKWLGKSIAEIACEKAGIIKRGIPVVSGATQPEAVAVIERVAAEQESPMVPADPAYYPELLERVSLPLMGEHQKWNAACALATVEVLQRTIPVTLHQVTEGLSRVQWPGRMQLASYRGARIVLDGAHNPDGARALRQGLEHSFPGERFALVLGVFQDKAWQAMCRELVPRAHGVYLTPVQSERSARTEEVAAFCRDELGFEAVVTMPSSQAALDAAARSGFVVVAGSLHLIGEMLEHLRLTSGTRSERDLNEWDAGKTKQ